VVFDNDGLTLDTEIVWTRAEVTLFSRRGAEFTAAHKVDLVGNAGPVAAAKLAGMLGEAAEQGPAILTELNELVLEELARGCEAMPGAVALIAALREQGVPIGLCSNSPRRVVDVALEGSGLTGVFATTLAGDEVARQKPDPEPYATVCAALGVAPADCVALEDSPTGCTSARAAGLRVFGVPSVEGVQLDGIAHEVHASLEAPALWAALGL
jgi:HAD superfamily hydrolase (TIGR01509 family)